MERKHAGRHFCRELWPPNGAQRCDKTRIATTGHRWSRNGALLACLWEATAPKAGNVHRGADFEDLTFLDFATSALVIGPALAGAASGGVRWGESILAAVAATRGAVADEYESRRATAIGPAGNDPARIVSESWRRCSVGGARCRRYRRRLRSNCARAAGGLGKVEEADVTGPPPGDLLHAMRLAADRDLVARAVCDKLCRGLERRRAPTWRLGSNVAGRSAPRLSTRISA